MFCLGKGRCWVTESRLYVATPALLRYAGVAPATVDPSTDFLADPSVPTDELVTVRPDLTTGKPKVTELPVTNVQRIESRKLFGSPEGETALRRPRSSRSTVFAAAAGDRSRPAGSSSRIGL